MSNPYRSKRRRWTKVVCVSNCLAVLVFALLTGDLCAQSIQGSILGTVKDTSGAVIPGATVTLKNINEETTRSTTSNDSGNYQFIDAKAGRYTLEITRDGFEKWAQVTSS